MLKVKSTLLLWLVALIAGFATAAAPSPAIPDKAYSTTEAVSVAYKDALTLSGTVEQHELEAYKYFWVTTPEGKDRDELRAAFKLHVNLLNRRQSIAGVYEVTPWLWRIDMDELGWDRATLEAARYIEPFFHKQEKTRQTTIFKDFWPGGTDSKTGKFDKRGTYDVQVTKGTKYPLSAPQLNAKEITGLRELLYSEVPIVSAEWFIAQSARQIGYNSKQNGLGYYDFLQLKDRKDYFKLLRFDDKDITKLMLAVQEISGVSPLPRQMARFTAASGAVWVALDTTDASGKGVALDNLEHGEFKHQIEEWYGYLPNDLPATFLSNELGVRANNAPADAGGFGDNSPLNDSKDSRIHVNIACLRCHAGAILKPIDDYVRKVYTSPLALGVNDKKRTLALRDQYFSDIKKALKRDVETYVDAFGLATITRSSPKGLTPGKAVEAYAHAYHGYADKPITLEKSARELGVTPEAWKAALLKHLDLTRSINLQLAPLLPLRRDPPLPISRATWENVYPIAVEVSLGRIVLPDPKKPQAILEK